MAWLLRMLRGVARRVLRGGAWCYDLRLNIDTGDREYRGRVHPRKGWLYRESNASYDDAFVYMAADYLDIVRIVRKLPLQPHDRFYDIGCGKGRVVCMLARRPIERVVGIEIDEDLCRMARQNAATVRGRRAAIEVRCEDASRANVSDGTIFYFWNPFGPATFRAVLANIRRSIDENPREVTFVYLNPVFKHVFLECEWISEAPGMRTLLGTEEICFFVANPGRDGSVPRLPQKYESRRADPMRNYADRRGPN